MSADTPASNAAPRRPPRWVLWLVLGLVAVLAAAVAVALYFTSQTGFLARYHTLARSSATLQASAHKDIPCNACHEAPSGEVSYRIALVGDFYRGLIRRPKQPVFVRLPKPTREACLSCHTHDWSWDAKRTAKVPHPAHLRTIDERRDCVNCHKWTAHEEAYMQKHKAMPFSTVCASFGCHVGWKQSDECASCHHSLQEGKGEWKKVHRTTVQAFGPNGCLETCHDADQCRQCHTTGKRPAFKAGGVTGVTEIERAHVKKDWTSQHGTFALANATKCLTCHVSEAECKECHAKRPAFHGDPASWLTRHEALSKNKKRCLTCHEQKFCDECHKQFKEMR